MEPFIRKDGKQLRLGYTTGSCAAASAKAAAWMLLSGKTMTSIRLQTPKGILLELPVLDITQEPDAVSCAVRKDSGDDPDVTDGILIYAKVSKRADPGILIEGGTGVGRVTKPGLDQPVGAAAINSVPRKMIRENLEEICSLLDHRGGLSVIISVPEGENIAKRTFNSRLGIIGGISILGTSGIVEPMSDRALVETIRLELKQRREDGQDSVLLTPGNYGKDFLQGTFGIDPKIPVMTSNFIGDALDLCRELGFSKVLLTGHIGKLVKLAGGMFNTHSRFGDCRMEILAAYAGACGADPQTVRSLLDCASCDDALRIMKENQTDIRVLLHLRDRIYENLNRRTGDDLQTEVIVFSNVYGILCESVNAGSLIRRFQER